jgi:hypothetical protein
MKKFIKLFVCCALIVFSLNTYAQKTYGIGIQIQNTTSTGSVAYGIWAFDRAGDHYTAVSLPGPVTITATVYFGGMPTTMSITLPASGTLSEQFSNIGTQVTGLIVTNLSYTWATSSQYIVFSQSDIEIVTI